jgi:glutamine phosphoribosylpyrophosphate amidotransferase
VWAELDEMQRSGAPALAPGKVLTLSEEWRAALHEAFLKSETYAASMCQPLKPMLRGESITGKLVLKQDLPSGQALVLVDDGKGTLHRGIVRNVGDVRSGAKVTLEITRDARVTLSRGLEQSRGRGMRR